MKVHHVNCGSMHFPGAPLVCHVLLLETDGGLVLVDSGFGLTDTADPAKRIGVFRRVIRPVLDPEETAISKIERLGFRATDVQHILLTHLDCDHIGGISDFPHARAHVTSAKATGAALQEEKEGPAWELAYRVVPMCLDAETRTSLPMRINSPVVSWVAKTRRWEVCCRAR